MLTGGEIVSALVISICQRPCRAACPLPASALADCTTTTVTWTLVAFSPLACPRFLVLSLDGQTRQSGSPEMTLRDIREESGQLAVYFFYC